MKTVIYLRQSLDHDLPVTARCGKIGPRLFDTNNSLTPGWGHRLYWIGVLSTVN
jgi:hypothetical protein